MNKNTIYLLFFVLIKFIIQFTLISPEYELHRDEYLHLDQANHLAWGYVSVPPFTSWISYLILLLGNGVFWVKFFPALFGALTIVVVWKTIEELQGGLFALVLGATGVLFSAILRINLLHQPNSADIFFWTLSYFLLIKYYNSNNSKWLYVLATAFAFGLLNKYNILFLLIGLIPAILFTKQRIIFLNKHLYFSILLGIILIMPNILWQYQNNFPVLHHMNELAATQLEKVNRLDFIKEQLLFFIGSFFVILSGLIALLRYTPFKKYNSFLLAFIFTISVFIYFKAKGYYAIGLYPIYLAFGAVYLEYVLQNGWKKSYLQPVCILIPILLFIPVAKVAFPNSSPLIIQQNSKRYKDLGLLRWEDGKEHTMPQDFADMLGWKELASKTDKALQRTIDIGYTIILCDNYGQAGAINYYSLQEKNQAVTYNADYINWFPLQQKIKNIILVKEGNEVSTEGSLKKCFKKTILAGSITNKFARERHTQIYILEGAMTDVNNIIRENIKAQQVSWN